MSFIGPQIPAHFVPVSDNSDDDDDYTPALPPELAAARKKAGPSSEDPKSQSPANAGKGRVYGPALPHAGPSRSSYPDSDSDSEVGPQPLPSSASAQPEKSAVEEFIEREERRRKNVEEASRPKKLVREEWMLVPPKSADLLGSLDPTKLKARQFGRSSGPGRDTDSSLWTETPAERQQRLADEVSGRKRRAVNADPVGVDEDPEEARKRRKRDEEIRKGVEEHTRTIRGAALVNAHMDRQAQKKKDVDEEPSAIWDHARDMSLGGRLMDDKQRQRMLRDAKTLGDRFGAGKSGGFL
ncbi:hypothetical protein J3A83DRAFT_4535631 [Scleroderma citrinum]